MQYVDNNAAALQSYAALVMWQFENKLPVNIT